MDFNNLLLEKENGICILYMNRPKALNAINEETLLELEQAIKMIAVDDEIKAIILTGAGDKAFVAGADIKYMSTMDTIQSRNFAKLGQRVFRSLELMEKPVIAAINGFALGGGCELAMSADIRLASEKAKFGQPEVNLGVIPGYRGTQRLPRLVGEGRAKELIYTGSTIKAEEAYRIGLVNHVYPADQLMDEAKKLANKIMANAPKAISYSKTAIDRGMQVDIETGATIESDLFGLCFATADQKNGMQAFMNKEKPVFTGK